VRIDQTSCRSHQAGFARICLAFRGMPHAIAAASRPAGSVPKVYRLESLLDLLNLKLTGPDYHKGNCSRGHQDFGRRRASIGCARARQHRLESQPRRGQLPSIPLAGRARRRAFVPQSIIMSTPSKDDDVTRLSQFPVQTAGSIGAHRANQGLQPTGQPLYVVVELRDAGFGAPIGKNEARHTKDAATIRTGRQDRFRRGRIQLPQCGAAVAIPHPPHRPASRLRASPFRNTGPRRSRTRSHQHEGCLPCRGRTGDQRCHRRRDQYRDDDRVGT